MKKIKITTKLLVSKFVVVLLCGSTGAFVLYNLEGVKKNIFKII